METHLPPSDDNPLTQHGKKDTGTLWDQERDELAVRILLEEGKLNLALRILHKYRVAVRDSEKFTAAIKSTSEKFNSDVVTVTDRCRVFEQSVGILLKFAFSHVEALQIMDLPEFLEHCTEVIRESEASTRAAASPLELDKLQETLVIHYLAGLAGAMEEMDEDRAMDLIQEHNLLPLFISHLTKHYTWYKLDALMDACRFLNGAMSSEAYQADRTKFISDKKTIQELVGLKGLFLNEMLSPGLGGKKKDVQMLLDEIAKFERSPGITPSKETSTSLKERLEKWKGQGRGEGEIAEEGWMVFVALTTCIVLYDALLSCRDEREGCCRCYCACCSGDGCRRCCCIIIRASSKSEEVSEQIASPRSTAHRKIASHRAKFSRHRSSSILIILALQRDTIARCQYSSRFAPLVHS